MTQRRKDCHRYEWNGLSTDLLCISRQTDGALDATNYNRGTGSSRRRLNISVSSADGNCTRCMSVDSLTRELVDKVAPLLLWLLLAGLHLLLTLAPLSNFLAATQLGFLALWLGDSLTFLLLLSLLWLLPCWSLYGRLARLRLTREVLPLLLQLLLVGLQSFAAHLSHTKMTRQYSSNGETGAAPEDIPVRYG